MKLSVLVGLLITIFASAAHAECTAPRLVGKQEAQLYENSGTLVALNKRVGSNSYDSWPTKTVLLLQNRHCYLVEQTLAATLNSAVGAMAINNHIDIVNDAPVNGTKPSELKQDMALVLIKLYKKSGDTGAFSMKVSRNACDWYRGSSKQLAYKPGQAAPYLRNPNPRSWNNSHDRYTDIAAADVATEGAFHGAASPQGVSTFDASNRRNFRFSEDLTRYYDIEVNVRLMCFDIRNESDSLAKMINFEANSGDAGLIVSYFSASAGVSGAVRLCTQNECPTIENLNVDNPFSGFLASIFRVFS